MLSVVDLGLMFFDGIDVFFMDLDGVVYVGLEVLLYVVESINCV